MVVSAQAPKVFISHTHADERLAHALKNALHTLFGGKVAVRYSTSKELEGGISPGEDWIRWINQQVQEAHIAFILLTPASIQKPWVIWEAGAVSGVALASQGEHHHKLRPVRYRLNDSDIPAPFSREQITDGLDRGEIEKLFNEVLFSLGGDLDRLVLITGGKNLDKACRKYLAAAAEAMRLAPILITEAAVQEWLERINDLAQGNRESEIGELHDWLNLAFGQDSTGVSRPLDVRLHRRLGELYARSGAPVQASREFELARYLAPRDLFILRRLGKAYLDQGLPDQAGAIIAEIEGLDSKAFIRNAENAALKARWCRARGASGEALKVLELAWAERQTSYYLGDLLGQAQLAVGAVDEARLTYRIVMGLVCELAEPNVFSAASGLTASLVIGDNDKLRYFLSVLQSINLTTEQAASTMRGMETLGETLKLSPDLLAEVRLTLAAPA